jgi:membrane-associated phospholipid phosphatase
VLAFVGFVASPAAAEPSPAPSASEEGRTTSREPHRLEHAEPTFLAAELVVSSLAAGALSLSAGPSPDHCRFCGTNDLDVAIRNVVHTNDSRSPALASHIVSLGAVPLLALGAVVVPALESDHGSYALADGVVIVSGFVLTSGLADFSKKVTARERPAFYYGRQAQTESAHNSSDRYRSFFSADTAWAFSVASSGAALAYERGYWTAPFALAGGAVFGAAAGGLRMVADMHWFTDVLVGAAVGTGAGLVSPLLLHRRADPSGTSVALSPVVAPGLTGVVATGSF